MGRPGGPHEGGRPPIVHRDEVFAAAEECCRKGRKPSRQSVVAVLGFGNCNRTSVFVDEWWRSLPDRLEASGELEQLRQKVKELLHELSLCRITHLECTRQEHLENLISEVRVRI